MKVSVVPSNNDLSYYLSQDSAETARIVAGMTAIIDVNEDKLSVMQNQKWFQRMWFTVSGKNKATVKEMEQNRDKLAAYSVQVFAKFIEEKRISDAIISNLTVRLNEIYSSHLQLQKIMYEIVNKLNAKIDSVDNYQNLITDIQNDKKYDPKKIFGSLLEILSLLDKRVLADQKHLIRIKETMEKHGFIFSQTVSIIDFTEQILALPEESIGQVYLFAQSHTKFKFIQFACCLIEKYHFEPKSNRKIIKDSVVKLSLGNCGLTGNEDCDVDEFYDDIQSAAVDKFPLREIPAPKDNPKVDVGNIKPEPDSDNSKEPAYNTDTMELVDNTKTQYSQLREVVGKCLPYISGAFFSKDTPKKINTFIDEHALMLDKDSVIAFVDTSLLEDGTFGLLLTTHAIYYKETFEDIVKVPYSGIDYSRCKLQYDKKGKAKALDIVQKTGNVLSVDIFRVSKEKMLTMLVDISKLSSNEYAPTDSPISISKMDYSVKLLYIKLLVNFLAASNLSCAELMRFACDLDLGDYELSEVAKYIVDSKESDLDLLLQINKYVPYASLKSLRYALIIEMFRQLQFIKHTSDVAGLEHEYIRKIAKIYIFSDDDVAMLKTVAQTEYKILTGEIKSDKELKTVQNALGSIALSSGISVTTVVASNFWLLNAGWLRFIPGIGQILGVLFMGKFIMDVFHEIKAFNEQRDKIIEKERESYKLAIEQLSHLFPGMLNEMSLLKKNMKTLF